MDKRQPISIAVVGSGYVGLVASACFAEIGHNVICVDNDEAKVRTLRDGGIPIHEEYLPELLSRYRDGRLEFTSDLRSAAQAAQAIFIAVGTLAKLAQATVQTSRMWMRSPARSHARLTHTR